MDRGKIEFELVRLYTAAQDEGTYPLKEAVTETADAIEDLITARVVREYELMQPHHRIPFAHKDGVRFLTPVDRIANLQKGSE